MSGAEDINTEALESSLAIIDQGFLPNFPVDTSDVIAESGNHVGESSKSVDDLNGKSMEGNKDVPPAEPSADRMHVGDNTLSISQSDGATGDRTANARRAKKEKEDKKKAAKARASVSRKGAKAVSESNPLSEKSVDTNKEIGKKPTKETEAKSSSADPAESLKKTVDTSKETSKNPTKKTPAKQTHKSTEFVEDSETETVGSNTGEQYTSNKDKAIIATPEPTSKPSAKRSEKKVSKGKAKNSLDASLEIAEDDEESTGGSEDGSVKRKRSSSTPPVRRKQLKIVTHAATPPSTKNLAYSMGHYKLYNPKSHNIGTPAVGKHTNFDVYDSYSLFFDSTISVDNFVARVPTEGVRLDDLSMAMALQLYKGKKLNEQWPAEFDLAGMPRALRVPMGHAYKRKVGVGELDVNGEPATEAGWYYLWWKGLHILCGKEGLDAKIYRRRPSFEKPLCAAFGFKIGCMAAIQHRPGSLNDPTFQKH